MKISLSDIRMTMNSVDHTNLYRLFSVFEIHLQVKVLQERFRHSQIIEFKLKSKPEKIEEFP